MWISPCHVMTALQESYDKVDEASASEFSSCIHLTMGSQTRGRQLIFGVWLEFETPELNIIELSNFYRILFCFITWFSSKSFFFISTLKKFADHTFLAILFTKCFAVSTFYIVSTNKYNLVITTVTLLLLTLLNLF